MRSETSDHIFERLGLWLDQVPRDGPEQMACDEALLGLADRPVMRVFRWSRSWVSVGYFTAVNTARSIRPDLPVCRRWTGGGIVIHEADFTFSLVVPSGETFGALRAAESYRRIHGAVATALIAHGVDAALSAGSKTAADECFVQPVAGDVVSGGRKIAGGAQRRTRRGLLHQGSIQGVTADADFAHIFAGALARTVEEWTPPVSLKSEAQRLTREKYDKPDFLRDRKNFTAARMK